MRRDTQAEVRTAPKCSSSRVSVIIPTKYRPAVVERTVGSVFAQTMPPWQVIVIDQSPAEETRNRISTLHSLAAPVVRENTRLVYLHDATIAGAAAARNRGIELADGDIWLFLDDDVLLEADFIAQLLDVYRRYPNTTGVSGIFTNYVPPSLAHRTWSRIFLRGPFDDERQPIYWSADQLRNRDPLPVRKFTGALMSFKAAAIRNLRFDENIGRTGPEDVDFCMCLHPGSILLVAPAARLYHERAPAGRSDQHWIQTQIEMAYYLYRRKWHAGICNKLCFAWLIVGYALATALSSIRRRSLAPCRGLIEGIREGSLQVM